MRLFADGDLRRKHALAEAVEQKGGLAIEAAAAGGIDVVADQAGRDRRLEHDRAFAASPAGGRPAAAPCARRRGGRPAPRARDPAASAPRVYQSSRCIDFAVVADHRAIDAVARTRIAGAEAVRYSRRRTRLRAAETVAPSELVRRAVDGQRRGFAFAAPGRWPARPAGPTGDRDRGPASGGRATPGRQGRRRDPRRCSARSSAPW